MADQMDEEQFRLEEEQKVRERTARNADRSAAENFFARQRQESLRPADQGDTAGIARRGIDKISDSNVQGRARAAALLNPATRGGVKPSELSGEGGAQIIKEAQKSGIGRDGIRAYTKDLNAFRTKLGELDVEDTDSYTQKASEISSEFAFSDEAAREIIKESKPAAVRQYEAEQKEKKRMEVKRAEERAEMVKDEKARGLARAEAAIEAEKLYKEDLYERLNVDRELIEADPSTLTPTRRLQQRSEQRRVDRQLIAEGKLKPPSQMARDAADGKGPLSFDSDGNAYDASGEKLSIGEQKFLEDRAKEYAREFVSPDVAEEYFNPKPKLTVEDLGGVDGEETMDFDPSAPKTQKMFRDIRDAAAQGREPSQVFEEYSEDITKTRFVREWEVGRQAYQQQVSRQFSDELSQAIKETEEEGFKFASKEVEQFTKKLAADPQAAAYNYLVSEASKVGAYSVDDVEDVDNPVKAQEYLIEQMAGKARTDAQKDVVSSLMSHVSAGTLEDFYPEIAERAQTLAVAAKYEQLKRDQTAIVRAHAEKNNPGSVGATDQDINRVLTMQGGGTIATLRNPGRQDGITQEEIEGLGFAIANEPRLAEAIEAVGIGLNGYVGQQSFSDMSTIAAILVGLDESRAPLAEAIDPDAIPPRKSVNRYGVGTSPSQVMAGLDKKVSEIKSSFDLLGKASAKKKVKHPDAAKLLELAFKGDGVDESMVRAAVMVDYKASVKAAKDQFVGVVAKAETSRTKEIFSEMMRTNPEVVAARMISAFRKSDVDTLKFHVDSMKSTWKELSRGGGAVSFGAKGPKTELENLGKVDTKEYAAIMEFGKILNSATHYYKEESKKQRLEEFERNFIPDQ